MGSLIAMGPASGHHTTRSIISAAGVSISVEAAAVVMSHNRGAEQVGRVNVFRMAVCKALGET